MSLMDVIRKPLSFSKKGKNDLSSNQSVKSSDKTENKTKLYPTQKIEDLSPSYRETKSPPTQDTTIPSPGPTRPDYIGREDPLEEDDDIELTEPENDIELTEPESNVSTSDRESANLLKFVMSAALVNKAAEEIGFENSTAQGMVMLSLMCKNIAQYEQTTEAQETWRNLSRGIASNRKVEISAEQHERLGTELLYAGQILPVFLKNSNPPITENVYNVLKSSIKTLGEIITPVEQQQVQDHNTISEPTPDQKSFANTTIQMDQLILNIIKSSDPEKTIQNLIELLRDGDFSAKINQAKEDLEIEIKVNGANQQANDEKEAPESSSKGSPENSVNNQIAQKEEVMEAAKDLLAFSASSVENVESANSITPNNARNQNTAAEKTESTAL